MVTAPESRDCPIPTPNPLERYPHLAVDKLDGLEDATVRIHDLKQGFQKALGA